MHAKSELTQTEQPSHYQLERVEAIDIIRERLTAADLPPFESYCLGNALKYLLRAGSKGDAGEDLAKARNYLVWATGGDFRTQCSTATT